MTADDKAVFPSELNPSNIKQEPPDSSQCFQNGAMTQDCLHTVLSVKNYQPTNAIDSVANGGLASQGTMVRKTFLCSCAVLQKVQVKI